MDEILKSKTKGKKYKLDKNVSKLHGGNEMKNMKLKINEKSKLHHDIIKQNKKSVRNFEYKINVNSAENNFLNRKTLKKRKRNGHKQDLSEYNQVTQKNDGNLINNNSNQIQGRLDKNVSKLHGGNEMKNMKLKINEKSKLHDINKQNKKPVKNFEHKINVNSAENNFLNRKTLKKRKRNGHKQDLSEYNQVTRKNDENLINNANQIQGEFSQKKETDKTDVKENILSISKNRPSKEVKFQLDAVKKNTNTEERNERTVFIGNLPHNVKIKHIQKMFSPFGKVEKLRLRGAIKANGKISKKITMQKRLFDENHPKLIAYVLFSTKHEANNALQMNGSLYNDHHLRVNLASYKATHNKDNSVFLGNLPFIIQDDEIWKLFQQCGKIESVRIIRDSNTGIGKGFGYVNFKSSSSSELALQMDGQLLRDREIRVSRILNAKKRDKILRKTQKKIGHIQMKNKNKQTPSFNSVERPHENFTKKIHFRGQVANLSKKKPKMNKLQLKNKVLAKKLTAKSRKKEKTVNSAKVS